LLKALKEPLEGLPAENLQAHIRGMLLMALSNRNGWLVLSTGNKSELSTGYCTLYGDMVGGFAPIKDLPKKMVYQLSRTANRFFKKTVIPRSVFVRPPTAELRFNQTDQDTLPPYDLLDQVIRLYVEGRVPLSELRKKIPSSKINLARVVRMINGSEYKRRQAAVGVKITPLAFGRDRRMPMTNGYQEN
jgi:NAD+ synthase (glutamine-hydrolysing)